MPTFHPKDLTSTAEFDYVFIKNALKDYLHPRVKINQLLASGYMTRVKKGIYVKNEGGYSPPVLANMIYGPSYVSQDYALSLYGLIPEQVLAVTSMTLGRRKAFKTPVGVFTYESLDSLLYPLGLRYEQLDINRGYLVASPEKALIDRIWRIKNLNTPEALSDYLEYDMRFNFLGTLSLSKLRQLAKAYDKPIIWNLEKVLKERMSK